MKKTLLLVLSLLLTFSFLISTASCELMGIEPEKKPNTEQSDDIDSSEIISAEDAMEGKKAATGLTINEDILKTVINKNTALLDKVDPFFSGDVTVTEISASVTAKDENSTFSFTTEESYEVLDEFLKDEDNSEIKASISSDAELVPGKYYEITLTLNLKTEEVEIKHKKAADSDFQVLNLADFDSSDQLACDVLAIMASMNVNTMPEGLFELVNLLLNNVTGSPIIKCSFSMIDNSDRIYLASMDVAIKKDGDKIITTNKINISRGVTEFATLSCNLSLNVSDDFSYKAGDPDNDVSSEITGSVDFSISNLVLKMDEKKYVLNGTLAATIDFSEENIVVYVAMSEKIGNDTIFDFEAGLKVLKAGDVEGLSGLLDCLTIYKCDVLGKSYSSLSVKKLIASLSDTEYDPEPDTGTEYITIIYDLNGADTGSTTPASQKLEIDAEGIAKLNIASLEGIYKEGYYLYGWNTKSDGTGSDYNKKYTRYSLNKKYLPTINSNNEMTLYAKWIKSEEVDGFIYMLLDSGTYAVLAPSSSNTATNITILESVNGKKVTAIYDYAFNNKDKVQTISLPSSVTSIGKEAFHGCSNLTTIVIPTGVTKIENGTFLFSGLTSIEIPKSVKELGTQAFAYCRSLESLTLNVGLESIGFWALEKCTKLSSITYKGTIEQWNSITKKTGWNEDSAIKTIHCSDGDITL